MEFKGKTRFRCFPEMKFQQGFTTEIGFLVFNLLGLTIKYA